MSYVEDFLDNYHSDETDEQRLAKLQHQGDYNLAKELMNLTNEDAIKKHEAKLKLASSQLPQMYELYKDRIAQAEKLLKESRYGEALDTLEFRGLNLAPMANMLKETFPVRELLTKLYRRQGFDLLKSGQHQQAIAIFEPLEKKALLSPWSFFGWARALRMAVAKQAPASGPHRGKGHDRDIEEAARVIDKAIDASPRVSPFYIEKSAIWVGIALVRSDVVDRASASKEHISVTSAERTGLQYAQDETVEALAAAWMWSNKGKTILKKIQALYEKLHLTQPNNPLDLTPLVNAGLQSLFPTTSNGTYTPQPNEKWLSCLPVPVASSSNGHPGAGVVNEKGEVVE